ncbi:transcription elongation factor, mitochondrial [Phodopus roborovskii]|uniref:Transcription elongation factor, mitochondrial n=1 Tax=Phodopus roborovskii TaxID=109678 RepID=A0AAU9YZA8_PHORO|nr:transcription elongation factor, mitochondrial [Phodopus roborovskii]CAH6785809.1 Tefm [Phodopus roborovskii]
MAWRTNLASLIKPGGSWRWLPVSEYSSLPPVLNDICSRRKSTAPEKTVASVVFDTNGRKPGDALDKLFTPEQQASILHVLNTASDKELEAFRLLRGRKSVSIVEHRKKFGPFQSLESLIDVPLIQYKTAVQVCNSILCPESGRKKKSQEKWLLGKFIKPGIERERLKAVSSIISIVFGTRRIAWAHLDRKPKVLDWQQTECWNLTNRVYPSSVYLEEISSVISKMPQADLYILEKSGPSMQNTSLFPILLHFLITEAMLYALLNKTFAKDGQHRVLSMNRNVVGKHFDLMIGDTRTSGRDLVKQFLSDSVLKEEPRVVFPQERVVQYRQKILKDSHHIEELYDSLLQAIAFYELVFGKGSELQ